MRLSGRRPLWELPAECHEALIGCHWRPAALRQLSDRLFGGRSVLDDAALLAAAVAQCASRNTLSQALRRELDRRHAEVLRRTSTLADATALAAAWAEALRDGDVPAALWATLGDVRCDEALRLRVLQDLWLLQHERVATRSAEALARRQQQADLAVLREQSERLQLRHAERQRQAAAAQAALQAELAALRGRVQAQQAEIEALLAQRTVATAPAREALVQQVAALSQQLAALQRRPAVEIQLPAPPAVQPRPAERPEPPPLPAEALRDARVLCVGGRSAQVPQVRALVESRGGRFMHHDGGLEHSPHRLEAQLAGADLVLCQAGCLNHNAYARVKAHCKRHDKPCVYLDAPGWGRLLRGLASLPVKLSA